MSLLDPRRASAAVVVSDVADPRHPALIDDAGQLTYGALVERVAAVAAELPPVHTGRRLVHVPLASRREVVIGYLAVLRAGHVALITPPADAAITSAYPPDLWLRADGSFRSDGDPGRPGHLLHPELALLLSTSGSTGSPKLVRLSHDNLVGNADAIVAALSITPADRAVTSLPLHYCFGLSVLHAQLRAGGSILLRPGSVTDPGFGVDVRRHHVSLLPATPHLLDLLDVQGVLADLSSLRLVAQAGGALAPARVRELSARGRAAGWGLAVMYGQTEATARMAVLPPELAERYPDAVGWPVAGSAFRLDPVDAEDRGAAGVGELVFSGPGVMLGYAEHPDDLALGRMHTELRTGDLGTVDADGMVRIVGRRSDLVKVMGIRIDLGQVERTLRDLGLRCCVTGAEDQLQVTYAGGRDDADKVAGRAAAAAGLGRSVVSVHPVDAIPLLPNGKPDRRRCAALHAAHPRRQPGRAARSGRSAAVAAVLAPLVGRGGLDPERSFVELGGDSFSHVRASVGLTRLLGDLPTDWHHRPIGELMALADRGEDPRERRWRRLPVRRVETTVVLRGLAVLTICGSHVGLFRLAGGAHILLAVAGFLFARYVLAAPAAAERVRRTARVAAAVAAPAVLVAGVMVFGFGTAHWSHVALLHWIAEPQRTNIFWFVEALLVIIVVTTAVVSVPRVRAAYAADPWRTAMAALAVLLVPRYLVLGLFDGPVRGLPGTVGWLFVAGVAMAVADTRSRRLLTALVAVAATAGFFPEWERNLAIMTGLALLALLPTIPVPAVLVRPVGLLAAASLHIYLVQFQVFTFFDRPVVKFLAAIAAGLVFCAVITSAQRRLTARPAAGRPLIREDDACVDVRS